MIKREAEKTVQEIADTFRVLLVTGPRQVGKTTLLKEKMPKKMNYVTLDREATRLMAQNEPEIFLKEHPYPLLIDEAQYAPELFPYIKMMVDEKKERGMYWLTGSQQFKLMKNVNESLAGRVGIVRLNSLTYKEITNNAGKSIFEPNQLIKKSDIDVNDLFELIFKGGMPELYDIPNMQKDKFFESYIETYVSRDIPEILDIKDKEQFKKFMIAIASRTSEQLNYSSIAKEIGITDKTVRTWLDILVSTGLVYLLEPFGSSRLKQITRMPKIIFMDTGLCSYLAGWKNAKDLQLSSSSGHYFETFVISEIIKSYHAKGLTPNISYYRDKYKNEIDLLFYQNNTIYPFEIKKTSNPKEEMIHNFEILKNTGKDIGAGGIICFYEQLLHLNKEHYIIPVSSVIS